MDRMWGVIYFLFPSLQINFQNECGLDNKCTSNLKMTAQFVDEEDKSYPRSNKILDNDDIDWWCHDAHDVICFFVFCSMLS